MRSSGSQSRGPDLSADLTVAVRCPSVEKTSSDGNPAPAANDVGVKDNRRNAMATATIQLEDRVTDFISKPRKMLINGKWVEAASGKTFPTYNPATGEVLARVARVIVRTSSAPSRPPAPPLTPVRGQESQLQSVAALSGNLQT